MTQAYCDHNFVITACDGPQEYREKLKKLVASGKINFVFSPWHWVDMAEDKDQERSASTANFIDSLSPLWMYERRAVQGKEVAHAFFKAIGIETPEPKMISDLSDVLRELTGTGGSRNTRSFVSHLQAVGPRHPLRLTFRRALESNAKNIESFRKGIFSTVSRLAFERKYVKPLLPGQTPSGVIIDSQTKKDFLGSCNLSAFPSVALESAVTYDNWKSSRSLTPNTFLDQQHLMALPYVDLFITDDRKLTSLIRRVTKSMTFATAKVVTKAEFDSHQN